MKLIETWRWFGPDDPVSLADIRQTGAEGIVTALHHIPHGEIWPVNEILKRKELLSAHGFPWTVVESLTVHEDIKTRSGDYLVYIEKYKRSLENISACGIGIVTYNFMPVNDWTRTSLDYRMPDGSKALYFNRVDLAVFDIFLLKRKDASADYTDAVIREAEKKYSSYSPGQLDQLASVIMFGIPGEVKMTLDKMRYKLAAYHGMDHQSLRENLKYFLSQVVPVAGELGIRMAIHPDDPPFDIFGLPRIVSDGEDLEFITNAVPHPSNGICFCTGSLGVSPDNDLVEMIRALGTRIHFVHFRNTKRDPYGNFVEADHLGGDTDLYAVMKEILDMRQQVNVPIPFRPDHGHQMLSDLSVSTNPGYSCIGRMRGLAELRGMQTGILRSMGW
ncbi:MAG TPA: mannonate dehydratase [Chitinophagaceae bacterium]|nr:mannonate dehydratase [Chitinophagaceae bacterium]